MALEPVKRLDFSQALVHFTKERLAEDKSQPKGYKVIPPFDVLKEILSAGVLRGSGNSGYVKGSQRAVCLSEVPLSAISGFASPPSEEKAKYRFYGVTMSKAAIFKAGGRPVIYLPDDEAGWIPEDQRWRHVRYEHGAVDWTHEREWRIRGDLDLTSVPGLYVFVWSAPEAREIAAMKLPVSDLVRAVLPMEHITTML